MVLEVSGGAVYVESAEGNGGGALGHPVSSGPVSRLPGTQKPWISGKFCKNLEVPVMPELWTQLRPRKGKGGPKKSSRTPLEIPSDSPGQKWRRWRGSQNPSIFWWSWAPWSYLGLKKNPGLFNEGIVEKKSPKIIFGKFSIWKFFIGFSMKISRNRNSRKFPEKNWKIKKIKNFDILKFSLKIQWKFSRSKQFRK